MGGVVEKDIYGKDSGPDDPENGAALTSEFTLTGHNDNLARGLKSRHIQFLALGGAIGTGLFVGSGSILSASGPAPLFMVRHSPSATPIEVSSLTPLCCRVTCP